MKSTFLIFLLICIGGGYFYYANNSKEKVQTENLDDAQIAAQVMDAEVEDYSKPDAIAKLEKRLVLEARKLFPKASDDAVATWVQTQMSAKDKTASLPAPSYISKTEFDLFKQDVNDKNPFQYQTQFVIVKKALGAISDMARVSVAKNVNTAEFNAKRSEIEKRFRFDYHKQSEFMAEFADVCQKMDAYKTTMDKDEFSSRRLNALKKFPLAPARALEEFAEQCAAAEKLESEFSDPKYAARLRIAKNDFPEDYAKQYEAMKSSADVTKTQGAVALMNLKNARGEPINTSSIFMLRTITGAKAATLTNIRGKKVFLMPFFSPESNAQYTFENGKETVACSKFIASKDYPVICFFPDSEPATDAAVFMNSSMLSEINGLPEIAVGPNAVGVLSMDVVVPSITGEAHIKLETPLRSFPSGCVMIDKATGVYVSISVDYPRAPFLPPRDSLPSADTLVVGSPDARVWRNLILRLSTYERTFRETQEFGVNRFVKPSELEAWENFNKKDIDAQYALLENIYLRTKFMVKFFMTNALDTIAEDKPLKQFYDKASSLMAKSSRVTKGQAREYHKLLTAFLKNDIERLNIGKLNAALREEAEHQIQLRNMIIEYVADAEKNGNLSTIMPQ